MNEVTKFMNIFPFYDTKFQIIQITVNHNNNNKIFILFFKNSKQKDER